MIVLLWMGCVYFTYTDNWKIYEKPVELAKEKIDGWGEIAKKTEITPEPIPNITEEPEFGASIPVETPATGDSQNVSAITSPEKSEPTASEQPIPEQEQPAQEQIVYEEVENDYFADALFIGDSRTVGLYEYGGLEEIATFYASTGLTVYKMFTAPIVETPGQRKKQTIEEALSERQFAKIYLMIGINEMGTGTVDSFIEKYKEVVNHLRELQPDAIIYLQGIMKVTRARSEQGDYIHNQGIEERNTEIAKLADDTNIFYLDVNPLICDEDGGMIPAYTFDGIHLKAQYTAIWTDYLKRNAVKKVLLD